MHLFYAPGLSDETSFTLSAEESHHAIRVLRMAPGAEIILVNGRGGWYNARITDPGPKACTVEITGTTENVGKPRYDLHIGIAPTKQIDRFEWFIEKATEIGIGEITPPYLRQVRAEGCENRPAVAYHPGCHEAIHDSIPPRHSRANKFPEIYQTGLERTPGNRTL